MGAKPKKRPPRRHDWPAIRIAREVQGKSFRALADEFGASDSAIRARAKREGWRDPREISASVADLAVEEYAKQFVAQEAEAIRKNRSRVAAINGRILAQVEKRLESMEARDAKALLFDEDAVLELRRLSLIANTVEGSDARVGGLKGSEKQSGDDDWRSGAALGRGDSDSSEGRIREALDRLRET